MSEAVLSETPRESSRSQISEDVASVFERDPAARTRFEVYTIYPGVHGCLPGGNVEGDQFRDRAARQVCDPPNRPEPLQET